MTFALSDLYARQASTPYIGREGLTRLRSTTVAVAGAGGVGSAAAYYLARSGVGGIILIDQDIIEPSNLQRIHSATKKDLFHPKAEVVARGLKDADASIETEAIIDTITNQNAKRLFEDVDLIFDGLDNFRTRYILNNYSAKHETPYLFTSAVANQAHLALLHPPNTPCLECTMPNVVDRFEDSCESLGVTPRITGLTGAIGAQAAIQFLLGSGTRLTSEMMTFDLEQPEVLFTKLLKRKGCATCGKSAAKESTPSPAVTLLCGEHTANVLPTKTLSVQLAQVAASISPEKILLESDSVLVYKRDTLTISLFRDGRILITGVAEEVEALNVASEIWRDLEESSSVKSMNQ